MKELPENFASIDGFELLLISIHCKLGEKPVITRKCHTVSNRPNVVPAKYCDFISTLGSCTSERFYENGCNGGISSLTLDGPIGGFVYCLPENEEEVNAFLNDECELILNKRFLELCNIRDRVKKSLGMI